MNFINDRELARRLRDKDVPSGERLMYLIMTYAALGIVTSNFYYALIFSPTVDLRDHLSDALFFLLMVIGTLICYRVNERGDDKEFIERVVCLTVPIAIQTLILAAVWYTICYYVLNAVEKINSRQIFTLVVDILVFSLPLFIIYFYYRLSSAIGIASSGEQISK